MKQTININGQTIVIESQRAIADTTIQQQEWWNETEFKLLVVGLYLAIAVIVMIVFLTIALKRRGAFGVVDRSDDFIGSLLAGFLWPLMLIALPLLAIYSLSFFLSTICTKRNYCRLLIFWRDL